MFVFAFELNQYVAQFISFLGCMSAQEPWIPMTKLLLTLGHITIHY